MDFKQKFKNSLSPKVLAVAKSKRFKDKFILSATMLVLANCGGGGGGTTTQAPSTGTTVTGTVVKGPLSNAVVFADYNNDGILSIGEPSTRTASDGSFTLNSNDPLANLVSLADSQTTDTFTGENVEGLKLSAPGGSSVITPATTLLLKLIKSSSTTSSEVANALGLSGVDITSFNPFAPGVDQRI